MRYSPAGTPSHIQASSGPVGPGTRIPVLGVALDGAAGV